jgi:hypothetical protein
VAAGVCLKTVHSKARFPWGSFTYWRAQNDRVPAPAFPRLIEVWIARKEKKGVVRVQRAVPQSMSLLDLKCRSSARVFPRRFFEREVA